MSHINILFPGEFSDRILYYENHVHSLEQTQFGGLFNSLYPHDWNTHIGKHALRFRVTYTGTINSIHLHLHNPNGSISTLSHETIEQTHQNLLIETPAISSEPGQRISVEINHSVDTEVHSASWESVINKETKDVALAIVICTYNKESLLKKNVTRLLESNLWQDQNISLNIVNNGDLSNDFLLLENTPNLNIFTQDNLGGAGGFGRGILETLKNVSFSASHILLMDDDVLFEPEIIHRTIALYKYTSPKTCIGASMLKLEEPTYLHEAGSNIRSVNSIGTQTDISKGPIESTGALAELGRAHHYDYNAWWYSSFPITAAKEVGLPLPIFIHGDDIEYGIRLNSHGYKIYCPGGISLWHECFENKHATWIKYFDYRNAFIRLTQQSENTPRTITIQLNRIFKRCIIRNDYGSCAMLIEAFEDFCSGPNILNDKSFNDKIRSLKSRFMEHSNLPTTGRYRLSGDPNILSAFDRIRKCTKYLTNNLHYAPINSLGLWETDNTRYLWSDVPYLHDVRVKIKNEQYFEYTRCRRTAKELSKELKKLTRKFIKNKSECFSKWQDSTNDFTTSSFWKKYISTEE